MKTSIYRTKELIKTATLTLLKDAPFEKLTIASVCNEAGIARSTFYSNYKSLTEVVDELIEDAIVVSNCSVSKTVPRIIEETKKMSTSDIIKYVKKNKDEFPPCQRIFTDPRYKALFRDNLISSYILKTLFKNLKNNITSFTTQHTGLSTRMAEILMYYILNGSYAANDMLGWEQTDEWYLMQFYFLLFLYSGITGIGNWNKK